MNPPSLASLAHALTLTHPRLGRLHTDEEADVAAVLAEVDTTHRGDTTCPACAQPWPCPTWADAEALGLLYLGRAQDRVAAHARHTLDRLATRDRDTRRTA